MAEDKGLRGGLLFPGDQGRIGGRDIIDERVLFRKGGWAELYPKAHDGLYLMLDDGWDVSHGLEPWQGDLHKFGSLDPDPTRFASFGVTSDERLAGLVRKVRDCGWQGLGLWVACQCFGERKDALLSVAKAREVIRRKLEASARAGVSYWKVDWGVRDQNIAFRELLSEEKSKYYPALVLEHKPIYCDPVNPDNLDVDVEYNRRIVATGDVLRIYDLLLHLDHVTALERIAAYGRLIDQAGSRSLLNVEDLAVPGAVLGHAFGLMRTDREAEVTRAVNWQRIAPAFGGTNGVRTSVSDRRLTDEHFYPKGSIWYQAAEGKMIRQSAPAVIARGLTPPHVESVAGDCPFVLACRHPNGSLAFATHYRRFGDCVKTPLVRIESEIAWMQGVPLGCFGQFESLTLRMGNQSCRVYASDLAGGERREITQGVHFDDGRVTIPGEVLTPIRNRSVLDETNSMPGWLLECEKV